MQVLLEWYENAAQNGRIKDALFGGRREATRRAARRVEPDENQRGPF